MGHRGENLADGHYVIDEGVDPQTGVGTRFHFEGGEITVERYQDMEPVLEYVRQQRERFAGMRWDEGKPVGHIPGLYYPEIMEAYKAGGRTARAAAVKAFFKRMPQFCWFPDYLKD